MLLALATSDSIDDASKAALRDRAKAFVPNDLGSLRQIRMCKTEVMHSSETVRFKLSIPSDPNLENQLVDLIMKVESCKQWIGPRPAGYLEQEAQKLLGNK